jgi:hypothetical protein
MAKKIRLKRISDDNARADPASEPIRTDDSALSDVTPSPPGDAPEPQTLSAQTGATTSAIGLRDPLFNMLREQYEIDLEHLVREPTPETPDKNQNTKDSLLARYVELVTPLSTAGSVELYRVALIGIGAHKAGRTQVASRIADELNFATSTSAALGEVMRGLVIFIFGFGFLVFALAYSFVGLSFTGFDMSGVYKTIVGLKPILIATVFGCLGSVVSLLLRLHEFEVLKGVSRRFLRLTGLSLPVIGGVFAAVTASLFASKIINFSIQAPADNAAFNTELFIVIGFLSGFSERFTRGLLTAAENTFARQKPGTAGAESPQLPAKEPRQLGARRAR